MWQECWFSADCSSGHSSRRLQVWLNQTYSNYISPRVINLWQQSERVRLLCAFVLSDIVMATIGCVTLCLISATKVEITWQVVCVTERPLQRRSASWGVLLQMLTGVSSRRHTNEQSVLKIRRSTKRTSRRVVVVRSVKRDLSVLSFRFLTLALSREQNPPCLTQMYLWFIIQKSGSRQEVHRLPGVLWCPRFYAAMDL